MVGNNLKYRPLAREGSVLFKNILSIKYYVCVFLMSLASFILSCSAPQKEVRAYIEENPNWKMVEACGYESCGPKVDYLTGKDIEIRVEFDRGNKNDHFDVHVWFRFVKNDFEFDPSNVHFELGKGETLTPKVFRCRFTDKERKYLLSLRSERETANKLYLDFLRSRPSLQGPIFLKKSVKDDTDDCFWFFFDQPAPSLEEEVTMNFNKALALNSQPIDVPLVHFRKNVGKR